MLPQAVQKRNNPRETEGPMLVAARPKHAAPPSKAHLLSTRESVVEAGNVCHDGLLIGPESAYNICAERKGGERVKKRHGNPQHPSGMQRRGTSACWDLGSKSELADGVIFAAVLPLLNSSASYKVLRLRFEIYLSSQDSLGSFRKFLSAPG